MSANTQNEDTWTVNTTAHLNRAKVKQTALEVASKTRLNGFGKARFTRVSMEFLERIEARVRAMIAEEVRQQPSKGQTLM